jgi:predicted Fe-Mo cluster-binding NifX family protein
LNLIVFTCNGLISSPADADEYVVVDLSRGVVVIGPFRVRAEDYGVSKIAKAVSRVKLMGLDLDGLVVSRIGLKGLEMVSGLGLKVFKAEGTLEELISGSVEIREVTINTVDHYCKCCGLAPDVMGLKA